MKSILLLVLTKKRIRTIAIDIFAITFIYFVPAISHVLRIPVYLVEPMRIMLILSLAHTTKRNSYIIALTLPFFSFAVSGHPAFGIGNSYAIFKSILIALELVVNVWLFYLIFSRLKKYFPAILFSIIISKLLYYSLKFGLINLLVIDSPLVSTPLIIQAITVMVFSLYIFFNLRKPTNRYYN